MIRAHLAAELLVEGEQMPVFVWTIDHPAGRVGCVGASPTGVSF